MSQVKNTALAKSAAARNPMDLKHIKNLVELMVEHDLSRIELREGETHILLRRGQAPVVTAPPPPPAAPAPPAPAPAPAASAPSEPVVDANETIIRSPMVGTFYLASEPSAAPFVQPGTKITPDSVICIIEAMKVFNEIKAEVSGTISKILVNDTSAVEFDQPLFAVSPS